MKLQPITLLILATLMAGCVSFKSTSETANTAQRTPSEDTLRKVDAILDKAMDFQKTSEATALSEGR